MMSPNAPENKEIQFPGKTSVLGTPQVFKALTDELWSQNWVVNIQEPIEKPKYVLEYIAHYTHRVAISNDRILGLKDGVVFFRYKNCEKNSVKTCEMEAVEFIRRFMMKEGNMILIQWIIDQSTFLIPPIGAILVKSAQPVTHLEFKTVFQSDFSSDLLSLQSPYILVNLSSWMGGSVQHILSIIPPRQ